MGTCYATGADFHDHVTQLHIGGRKDAGTERPPEQTESHLLIPVQLEWTDEASKLVPFRHNGIRPYTREEVVRFIFDQQKTNIRKVLTRIKTLESEQRTKDGIVVESAFLDGLKQVEGGVGSLAKQLGITLGHSEG